MIVDTHCHIYGKYYDYDLDGVINKIQESKVNKIINNGCDSESNKEVLKLVSKYKIMYGALGIHPEFVDSYSDLDLVFIEKHLNDSKIVAIGEIGLDYHYTKKNKIKQIELFEKQLKIAEKFKKPVIIHCRDAHDDLVCILKKYNVKGVIHCFSGSLDDAYEFINMGFLIGVNGVVTFKNSDLGNILKEVDLGNIVLETDSPYLSPVPYRGNRNDPSNLLVVAEYICNLKNISLEELSLETNTNVKRCFDI